MNMNIFRLFLIAIVSIALISACGVSPKKKTSGNSSKGSFEEEMEEEESADEKRSGEKSNPEDLLADEGPVTPEEPALPAAQTPIVNNGIKDPTQLNFSDNLFLGIINLDQPYNGRLLRTVDNGDEEIYNVKARFIDQGSEIQMIISFPDGEPYEQKATYAMSFSKNYIGSDGKPKLKEKNMTIYYFDPGSSMLGMEFGGGTKSYKLDKRWRFTKEGDLVGEVKFTDNGMFSDDQVSEEFTFWIGTTAGDNKSFEAFNEEIEKTIAAESSQTTKPGETKETAAPKK